MHVASVAEAFLGLRPVPVSTGLTARRDGYRPVRRAVLSFFKTDGRSVYKEKINPAPPTNFGFLALDLWTLVVLAFIYEAGVAPDVTAYQRGIIARVCAGWQAGLYTTSVFWSRITVPKDMHVAALEFTLSKCSGDLHLSFPLLNVRQFLGHPLTPFNAISWVNTIFDRIGPTSPRWKSFCLDTEYPFVFNQFRIRCSDIQALSLDLFDISYTYLPGFAADIDFESGLLPFQPASWFGSSLTRLTHLSLSCVPLLWDADCWFERLEVVDLADFSCPDGIMVHVLPRRFALATRLRSLRLGAIVPFGLPSHFLLSSPSLTFVDLDFSSGSIVGDIFAAMDVPGLLHFAVRDVQDLVHYLIARPTILHRLQSFSVYGRVRDAGSFREVFASMPQLRSLDLSHAQHAVFDVYHRWVQICIGSGQLNPCIVFARCTCLQWIFVWSLRWSTLWLSLLVLVFVVLGSIEYGWSPLNILVGPMNDDDLSGLVNLDDYANRDPPFSGVQDPTRPYLWEDLTDVVLDAIGSMHFSDIHAFISTRSSLLLTTRLVRSRVCTKSVFWTRLIVSPRVRVQDALEWFELSDPLPVEIIFRATRGRVGSPFHSKLDRWLDILLPHLHAAMGCVTSLTIDAETHIMAVSCQLDRYTDIVSLGMRTFEFTETPSFGHPFRPFTSLTWVSSNIQIPVVSFATSFGASCRVEHPASIPISWYDAMSIVTASPDVNTLTIEGAPFDYRPGQISCSPPLPYVRTLLESRVAERASELGQSWER
ncbi:hypothetical protein B0H19DRAFT_1382878, partial [Mycena capillaripes]